MNIECSQTVLNELVDSFRFNDAILRHLVIKRDEAETEQSLIMKFKDEKGDKPERSDRGERRRRDDDSDDDKSDANSDAESEDSDDAAETA
jgi:small subunit ribosomal protein S6